MKTTKKDKEAAPSELKEVGPSYGVSPSTEQMVRTQIYLTRNEHQFLLNEASRRGEPMAAVLRRFIDEKMNVPEDAWTNNPILQPTVSDPDYEGREDASLNHEHYAYGAPRKYQKLNDKWVLQPVRDE